MVINDSRVGKYFKVIALDNRGVGCSSQPDSGYTIDDMADDVAELVEHCQLSSALVVGHSLGGAITQKLCINHPPKVKAAIIAGSIAKLPKTAQIQIETTLKLIEAGLSRELILATVFPWIYGNSFLENSDNIQAELKRIINECYPQTYEGYKGQIGAMDNYNTTGQLKNIRFPTLVLAGDEDLLIPIKYSEVIAKQIPDAQLKIIPNCGHMFYREQPKIFNDYIISFFKGLG